MPGPAAEVTGAPTGGGDDAVPAPEVEEPALRRRLGLAEQHRGADVEPALPAVSLSEVEVSEEQAVATVLHPDGRHVDWGRTDNEGRFALARGTTSDLGAPKNAGRGRNDW